MRLIYDGKIILQRDTKLGFVFSWYKIKIDIWWLWVSLRWEKMTPQEKPCVSHIDFNNSLK